ncbi:ankyrin-1-like [Photinus pyralis]|nr:ankyrin-1-like [Photinus pyralis]
MIQFGGDVSVKSVKGESPFYLAVFHHIECPYKEDATCIRALYYAGCDVNATNDKGIAPIHLAANFGHTNLVRWLLKKGASPNLQPYPYLLAQMNGHTVTARLLQNYQLRAIEQAE